MQGQLKQSGVTVGPVVPAGAASSWTTVGGETPSLLSSVGSPPPSIIADGRPALATMQLCL